MGIVRGRWKFELSRIIKDRFYISWHGFGDADSGKGINEKSNGMYKQLSTIYILLLHK